MRIPVRSSLAGLASLCSVVSIIAPSALGFGGNNGTTCPTPVGPDVIVGDIAASPANYTAEQVPAASGIWYDSFSFGTTSCNVGNMNVSWQAFSSNLHPAIGQGMFKYKNGRYEQIGISWLKHGFTALTQNTCGCGCNGSGGVVLGVGCSDPYTASRNGCQTGCTGGGAGPRYQVNAHTGFFPTGGTANPPMEGVTTARHLRVKSTDLEPSSGTILYFAECQYVTQDDATWGNQNNNASYRQLTMAGGPNEFTVGVTGTTNRATPGIHGWQKADPAVLTTDVQIPSDGLLVVGSRATDLGGGQWHYEYAVQNVNSDRCVQAFTIPLPAGTVITNIGFHDIQYSSNDGNPVAGVPQNFDGTDWPATVGSTDITWATGLFASSNNANALRWGTMYNFRFDANRPPQPGNATLTTYKVVGTVTGAASVPAPDCNGNNVADSLDIANGTSQDVNGNGIPDECKPPPPPCPSDTNGDQVVNVDDLLAVINGWGPCPPTPGCPGDITADGNVNVDDLLAVINAWGPCP